MVLLGALAVSARRSPQGLLDKLDRPVSELVVACRTARAVRAAHLVSALAEPQVAAMAVAVGSASALRRSCADPGASARSTAWWQPCLVVLTGVAVRRGLCRAIARQRPPAELWLTDPEGFSLPSKHASLAALTAGSCARAFGAGRTGSHAAALLAAATVGASRVCLGVHWPSDVLAGWAFAASWLDLTQSATSMTQRTLGGSR